MILPYLYNNNWHIREEIIKLLIVSFLHSENKFDSTHIIEVMANCLNDDPIKFCAREALATLCF